MDGYVVGLQVLSLFKQEQQFFAFIASGDEMGFGDMCQRVEGLGQVEHGREFDQYSSSFFQQQRFER